MSNHLTQRSFSALGWGYAGFLTRASAGFASGIVLARLLGPKPFGQVAAASLVFGFANQLADGGFNSALVQAPELSEADVRFAFTCQLATGGVLTVFCMLVAPAIAEVFRDPVITSVLRLTALLFIFQAFGLVSAALLKRQLAFRRLQSAQISSYLLGYVIVGISMARLGWGVWSLIAAQLVQSAAYSIMVYAQIRHSVSPCFSKRSIYLARFGVTVTGANILNWSLSNLDNAFIGRSFGSGALGLYSRAFNTVSSPTDAFVSTWQQVLFASCSRAGNRTALRRAYLASLSAITLVMLPTFWSVALCARTIVNALYGRFWFEVTPLLAPLAFAMTVHAAMAMAGPILYAVDQVRYEVKAQLISLMIAIAAFLVAARYSAVVMAWTVLAVYCVRFFAATLPTLRLLDLGWIHVLRATCGSVAVACLTALVAWKVDRLATGGGLAPVPTLIILLLAGIITASTLILAAGDIVLSPELVALLKQVSPSLPRALSRKVEAIAAKQAARETLNRNLDNAARTSSSAGV